MKQHMDWQAAAREAWLYGLPLVEMSALRARHAAQGARPGAFLHMRSLPMAEDRSLTTPNNDTLYSFCWVDLRAGPVKLDIPAIEQRYWSVAVMNMFTDNEAVLSRRTLPVQGGSVLLTGPDHADDALEAGLQVRVRTRQACIMLRIVIQGPDDAARVHALQDGFRVRQAAAGAGFLPAGSVAVDRQAAAGNYLHAVGRMLADQAPALDEAGKAVMQRLAPVLTGAWGPDQQEAVEQGVALARADLVQPPLPASCVNGWNYPARNLGRFGLDLLYRARVSVRGLAALPVSEAMYMRAMGEDGSGLFEGGQSHCLRLPARLPLQGFWSLTLYESVNGGFYLSPNALQRHVINDRMPGLRRREDGGIDLWIGSRDPGPERRGNWLPAPQDKAYALYFRCYEPDAELLDGRWRLPPLQAVEDGAD
ncbi:DUF1254 domain-containing protein [Comamonas composti]|uniref:DUF1254 domain-containing protein n=1 Tax=Comamonas composti TaxID=408558 RepID=UPI0004073186|nr:DUF1254 domain-containing protein [Comamonas composti]